MMVTVLILNTKPLWTILTILLLMMICREVFQMSVSLKRYIFTPENWIELLLIVFGKLNTHLISKITFPTQHNHIHNVENSVKISV